jgi:DNA adenine methylase
MGFGSAAHNAQHATGFRACSNRSGTTPAHDWMHYPDQVSRFTARLTGVVIENRPALEVIQQHDGPQTLHYIDPPYVHSARKAHQSTNYGAGEMTDDDHRELAEVLHGVAGMVLISGYACSLYDDELYPGWQRVTKMTAGNGNVGATARTEVLWISPRTVVQQSMCWGDSQ